MGAREDYSLGSQSPEKSGPANRAGLGSCAFLIACLTFSLALATRGWHHSILDGNEVRESQTAITAYYMVGRAPRLAYETPLLGPPWSIPFEFPIYQWTVAAVVTLFGTPLEGTGRAVNLAFFFLTLVPFYYLLAGLLIRGWHRVLILCLFVLCPFYIFWSRTFMIESAALFSTVTYAALLVATYKGPGAKALLAAMVIGVLAAAVKITTIVPVLALGLVAALAPPAGRPRPSWWARLGMVLVPLAGGLAWTRYADWVKLQNPISRRLTSAALGGWNFGGLEDRLNLERWETIRGWWDLVLGSVGFLVSGAIIVLALRRRRTHFFACLALGALAPLLFFNLHVVHDYYSYANGVFLILAVGIAVIALFEHGATSCRLLGCGLVVLILGAYFFRYERSFHHRFLVDSPAAPEIREVARAIQDASGPDEIMLGLGMSWSASVPYYSQRRALMIPSDDEATFIGNPGACAELLGAYPVGVLVVAERPERRVELRSLLGLLKKFDLDPQPRRVADWYLVFARRRR